MKIAFQMDPIDSLKFESDTTWLLMLAASKVAEVFYFTPNNLFWKNDALFAKLQKVEIENHEYKLSDFEIVDLTEMNIIFVRQDPPYDMAYLTTTYLLEKISDKVLILNDPKAIRDFPEKLSVLDYPDLIPKVLISNSEEEVMKFANEFAKIILKPLYSFAGNDVFCLSEPGDIIKKFKFLQEKYQTPIIAQQFIDKVIDGDKRIILVDGEPAGCYLRKPAEGEIRANLACGGMAIKSELTERDREICNQIKPMLQQNNLFLVGIDVIDSYLMEINITSPMGLVALERFENSNVADAILEGAIKKYHSLIKA